MKAAIIDQTTKEVLNVSKWDTNSKGPDGYICVILPDDFYVGAGFTYIEGDIFEAPIPAPQ